MSTHNGIIEDATGDLLQCGFQEFVAGAGETVRTDVPHPGRPRYLPGATQMHRWDGVSWLLVSQPVDPMPVDLVVEGNLQMIRMNELNLCPFSALIVEGELFLEA